MTKQSFQAIQIERNGGEAILDTFPVTKKRNAATAYAMAESLCELARQLPHKPEAFVRETNR